MVDSDQRVTSDPREVYPLVDPPTWWPTPSGGTEDNLPYYLQNHEVPLFLFGGTYYVSGSTFGLFDEPIRRFPSAKWLAELCFICVRNTAADVILQCLHWGFWLKGAGRNEEVKLHLTTTTTSIPTNKFLNTLMNDFPGYRFEFAPNQYDLRLVGNIRGW